jgi:putative DNA primase/helicase
MKVNAGSRTNDDEIPSILAADGRTETANAKRLVAAHGKDIRWVEPWSCWLVWDGRRWAIDLQRAIDSKAKEVAEEIWQMITVQQPSDRMAAAKFATSSASSRGIRSMIELARSETDVAILPEQLDADDWLLNVENGTLDLRTGRLRCHVRTDMATKICPVVFNPDAKCPVWKVFLETITDRQVDLIEFLQRAVGYSLTGDVREQVLLFCFGNGANGKSTFLNAIQSVLGNDYAGTAAPGLLLANHGEHHPTELASLHGKRFIESIETEDGRRLNEALLKSLTGGDAITARRMRENFWQFRPTHKLWVAGNHKPTIRGQDLGVWRRIRLIPFTVTIAPDQQDKQLATKLAAEREGILAWAVRGCLAWQQSGLGEPAAVREATKEYRDEQDVIGQFLQETTFEACTAAAKASELYAAYVAWAKRTGEFAVNQRRFGKAMTERGYERYTNNGPWYRGLGLVATDGTDGSGLF